MSDSPEPRKPQPWADKAGDCAMVEGIQHYERYVRVSLSPRRSIVARLASRGIGNAEIMGDARLRGFAVHQRYDAVCNPLPHDQAEKLLYWLLARESGQVATLPDDIAELLI